MGRYSRSGRNSRSDINPALVAAFVLVTVIIGLVSFTVSEIAYNSFVESMWRPLAIGLYFLIFLLVYFVFYFFVNAFTGTLNLGGRGHTSRSSLKTRVRTQQRRSHQSGHARGYSSSRTRRGGSGSNDAIKIILIAAGAAVAFFVLSTLFEFLYELGTTAPIEPTSYIFVIDDSGSMRDTDPEFRRVEAIHNIMADSDPNMEYAVYSFTENVKLVKDMSTWNENDSFVFNSYGGTDIIDALSGVLDDLESGSIDGGNSPRILLLSDGISSSWGTNRVVRRCRRLGVSVSTVSFPDHNRLLEALAERTGGVYIDSDDTDQLNEMMEEAITSTSARDLLSYRYVDKNNGLYAFLRILFLVLLGGVWSFYKYIIASSVESEIPATVVFIVSAILCIAAAIFMEVNSQVYSVITPRLMFVLLWSVSIGQLMIQTARRRRGTGGSILG